MYTRYYSNESESVYNFSTFILYIWYWKRYLEYLLSHPIVLRSILWIYKCSEPALWLIGYISIKRGSSITAAKINSNQFTLKWQSFFRIHFLTKIYSRLEYVHLNQSRCMFYWQRNITVWGDYIYVIFNLDLLFFFLQIAIINKNIWKSMYQHHVASLCYNHQSWWLQSIHTNKQT